ncbi:kinase-like protein [Cucurbitaria berberidis CBS 394.84]|uniref:Kinase-like protein n=1 Tax=Cucurbitaria berberidis CBS 394.84 TaxID=1168544 RepID=A0A9P4G9W2_9PLEO|nr:kinase-like protein [Cucurbitaria berberidis CBS 394.84]KAF1841374.1 kinase-like protein [Cucurbitaria berberidis CBS 394.84]
MAAALKIGQRLRGRLGTYTILKSVHENVWTASGTDAGTVIIKTAPVKRLKNEREILDIFQGCPHIRPLLDQTEEPSALVLKFLQDNLLKASNTRKLDKPEIKFVARGVLEALNVFHQAGYVHTDIKPDNILVNYGNETDRFSDVELGDCADAYRVDPNADPFEVGHLIGAAIFRSPEANLQLRWGTATDIWSFGATLISLIWGQDWHIFIPEGCSADDPEHPTQVLVKQASIFGPFPYSYKDIADEERQGILAAINNHINDNGLRKPFSMAEDPELTVEDRNFICKIMRMDPRDRPTAKELLEDPWFN